MCLDTAADDGPVYPLGDSCKRASETALSSGALQPLATSASTVVDAGIPFTVFSLDEAALAAKKKSGGGGAGGKKKRLPPPPNPFAVENRDPALVVTPLGANHVCILNKFNVLKDHALIITNHFEPQTSPLSADDLAAFYAGVTALPGVGFFNSGPKSGASQRHRHMQLLPYDALPTRPGTPGSGGGTVPAIALDLLVRRAAVRAAPPPRPGVTFTLPQLRLRHAVRLLDPRVTANWGPVASAMTLTPSTSTASLATSASTSTLVTSTSTSTLDGAAAAAALSGTAEEQGLAQRMAAATLHGAEAALQGAAQRAQQQPSRPAACAEALGAYLERQYRELLRDVDFSYPAQASLEAAARTRSFTGSRDSDFFIGDCEEQGGAAAFDAAPVAYNLVLTREYMFVAARARAVDPATGIDVNAMGFLGCVLTKGEEQARALAERGPLEVLRGVSMPPISHL